MLTGVVQARVGGNAIPIAVEVEDSLVRAGQRAGMALHRFANPTPPAHSEKHTIRTTLSPHSGNIDIYLYTPKDYQQRKSGKKFPLLVNFHGGGFTLGYGTDDCRWFGAVMEMTDAF